MSRVKFLCILSLVGVLYGCASALDDTLPTASDPGSAYPPPQMIVPVNTSGYPGPASNATPTKSASNPQPLPSLSADTGVVVGKLVDGSGDPYLGTLYLGGTINADQPGFQPIVSFSDQDPRADVDPATGQFVFADVPPGTYGLVHWTPVGSDLIFTPDRKSMLLITVSGGTVTDLGSVLFASSR